MAADVVSAQTVVEVLRAHGVDVFTRQTEHGLVETIMAYGEAVEVKCFVGDVSNRVLQQLTRKFPHVPIHQFYHPEQAPQRITH